MVTRSWWHPGKTKLEALEAAALAAAQIPDGEGSLVRLIWVSQRCDVAVRRQRRRGSVEERLLEVADGVVSETIRRWRADGSAMSPQPPGQMAEALGRQLQEIRQLSYDRDRAEQFATLLASQQPK